MIEFDEASRGLMRLIYASRSIETQPERLAESIRTIMVKSIHNNRLASVTGFLVFGGDRFLQLLEGPAGEIDGTFDRIRQDPRHVDIAVLTQGAAEQRLFRDWNMAQHQVSAADHSLLAESGLASFTPDALDESGALKVLTGLGGRYLRRA